MWIADVCRIYVCSSYKSTVSKSEMGCQVVEGYARFAPKCDAKSDCWQVSLRDAMTKCQKNVWHVTVCLSVLLSVSVSVCLSRLSLSVTVLCLSLSLSRCRIEHFSCSCGCCFSLGFHIAALCALLLNTDKHTNIPTFIYAYRGIFYIYIYIGNDMWMRQPQNLTRFCLPCKRCWVPDGGATRCLSLSLSCALSVALNRFRSASCHLPVARCIISFINCSSGLKRLNTDKRGFYLINLLETQRGRPWGNKEICETKSILIHAKFYGLYRFIDIDASTVVR